MALTRSELKELEGLILYAWGEDEGESVMAALMLDVAEPKKLRRLLVSRADDIEETSPRQAMRLRELAAKFGGPVLSEEKGPMYQRYRRQNIRALAEAYKEAHNA